MREISVAQYSEDSKYGRRMEFQYVSPRLEEERSAGDTTNGNGSVQNSHSLVERAENAWAQISAGVLVSRLAKEI